MNPYGRWLLAALLLLTASSSVQANEFETALAEQPTETIPLPPVPPAAWDAAPTMVRPLSVYVPNLNPGWELSAGALLVRPGADNLGFATITTFLPIQNPQWAVQNLDPGYQPGFSVGARYVVPGTGNDFRMNWEHLRTSNSSFVPVSNVNTQWISPFSQTGPSMSEDANQIGIFHFKSAQGDVDFDYDMTNFDFGQSVNFGPDTRVRFFAGLTFVRLQERLVSKFYNDPTILPVPPTIAVPDPDLQYIQLDNTSTYMGLGPRLGFNTQYNLFRGFTFVGELSGSVIEGRMQPAQYSFQGVFNSRTDTERIESRAVTQVVYAADAKIGFGFNRRVFNGSVLNIESGFKAAVFVNPFSTYETSTNVLALDIGSLSTSSMRHTPSNFTLSGFYFNCSLQF